MSPEHPATAIVFESLSELICMIAVFCFLVVGFLLHTEIISTAKREKDLTWKLDITNSCGVMIHYDVSHYVCYRRSLHVYWRVVVLSFQILNLLWGSLCSRSFIDNWLIEICCNSSLEKIQRVRERQN